MNPNHTSKLSALGPLTPKHMTTSTTCEISAKTSCVCCFIQSRKTKCNCFVKQLESCCHLATCAIPTIIKQAADVPPCTIYLACGLPLPEYSTSGSKSLADDIEFIKIRTFDQPEVALCCITPIDKENSSQPIGLVAVRNHAKKKLTERLLLVGHLANSPLSQPVSQPVSQLAN